MHVSELVRKLHDHRDVVNDTIAQLRAELKMHVEKRQQICTTLYMVGMMRTDHDDIRMVDDDEELG